MPEHRPTPDELADRIVNLEQQHIETRTETNTKLAQLQNQIDDINQKIQNLECNLDITNENLEITNANLDITNENLDIIVENQKLIVVLLDCTDARFEDQAAQSAARDAQIKKLHSDFTKISSLAEREVGTLRTEVAIVGTELATLDSEFAEAVTIVDSASKEVESASEKVESASKKVDSAIKKVDGAIKKVDRAIQKVNYTSREVDCAIEKVDCASKEVDCAVAKFDTALTRSTNLQAVEKLTTQIRDSNAQTLAELDQIHYLFSEHNSRRSQQVALLRGKLDQWLVDSCKKLRGPGGALVEKLHTTVAAELGDLLNQVQDSFDTKTADPQAKQ